MKHELKTEAQVSSLKLLTVGRPCGSKESSSDVPTGFTMRDMVQACTDRKSARKVDVTQTMVLSSSEDLKPERRLAVRNHTVALLLQCVR